MNDAEEADMGAAPEDVWSGTAREFPFPIEAGHVLAFERAIGASPSPGALAPPTFAAATDHFDPAYERRPPLGRGWDALPASHLHVEQHLDLLRPVRVGDHLVARRGPGRRWEKTGRSGRLRFVEERTELLDPSGACVQVMRWVDVHAERSHGELTNAQREPDRATTPPAPPEGDPVVVATTLSRTQFVMYAGASGDFHPLHHDDDLAHRHGYPSVFCPGMLTMALSCRALEGRIDSAALRSVSSRFRAQVWPGDTLTVFVREIDPVGTAEGARALALVTCNQHGAVVLDTVVHAAR